MVAYNQHESNILIYGDSLKCKIWKGKKVVDVKPSWGDLLDSIQPGMQLFAENSCGNLYPQWSWCPGYTIFMYSSVNPYRSFLIFYVQTLWELGSAFKICPKV